MTFHVGQKVVCVDAKARPGRQWTYDDGPVEGAVYTIQVVRMEAAGLCLILEEKKRHPASGYESYRAARFRPVVSSQTDISIFRAMLNPSKQGVDA